MICRVWTIHLAVYGTIVYLFLEVARVPSWNAPSRSVPFTAESPGLRHTIMARGFDKTAYNFSLTEIHGSCFQWTVKILLAMWFISNALKCFQMPAVFYLFSVAFVISVVANYSTFVQKRRTYVFEIKRCLWLRHRP